jgi:hypothetical protein
MVDPTGIGAKIAASMHSEDLHVFRHRIGTLGEIELSS